MGEEEYSIFREVLEAVICQAAAPRPIGAGLALTAVMIETAL
jgi:hypothetical protein